MRIEREGPAEPITPRFEAFLKQRLAGVNQDEVRDAKDGRIDFICLDGEVGVEIKSLEASADERIGTAVDRLRSRPDFPMFYGEVPLESMTENLSDGARVERDILDRVLRSADRHLKSANKQLQRFLDEAGGQDPLSLLVLINEDHAEYEPDLMRGWLERQLNRCDEGGFKYPAIHGVIFLSERHQGARAGRPLMRILAVAQKGVLDCPRRSSLIRQVMEGWAEFNGWNQTHREPDDEFVAVAQIDKFAPLHQRGREEYARYPYLASLSVEKLRDKFDELNVDIVLQTIKSSPARRSKQRLLELSRRFGEITDELKQRAVPLQNVPMETDRMIAAAKRCNLSLKERRWVERFFKDLTAKNG